MKALTIRLDDDQYKLLKNIAASRNIPLAELSREIFGRGLESGILSDQKDAIRVLVRMAVDDALKPVANRLASISAKGSIMAASATFLQLVALNKIAGVNKDVIDVMYAEAKAQGYKYVRDSKVTVDEPED